MRSDDDSDTKMEKQDENTPDYSKISSDTNPGSVNSVIINDKSSTIEESDKQVEKNKEIVIEKKDTTERSKEKGGKDDIRDRSHRKHDDHHHHRHRSRRSRERDRSRSPRRSRRRSSRSKSRDRNRDRSKEKEKRETTPPLKKKKKTMWDIPPDQVPETQTYPSLISPGNTRPSIQQLLQKVGVAYNYANDPHEERQKRRVYVGNIIPTTSVDDVSNFFNRTIVTVPERTPFHDPRPVWTATVHGDKMFAFVEFKREEDANIALSMDGIVYNGQNLKLRRPKDYQPEIPSKKYFIPGLISTKVTDGLNKIYVGNIPPTITDDDLKELVKTFGDITAFNMVKDTSTNVTKGYAFYEYADSSITEAACAGLNGLVLGGRAIVVKRATAKIPSNPTFPTPTLNQTFVPAGQPTVGQDTNMSTEDINTMLNMHMNNNLNPTQQFIPPAAPQIAPPHILQNMPGQPPVNIPPGQSQVNIPPHMQPQAFQQRLPPHVNVTSQPLPDNIVPQITIPPQPINDLDNIE